MKRPIEIDDFASIRYVSDPQLSPDGSKLAYVVTQVLLDEKRYQSRLWIRDIASGESIELTRGNGKDTSPRWNPDGNTIAFLTDRWGKNQIAVLDPLAGEAEQVSDLHDGILEFDWSSSGRGFLVLARADFDHVLKHQRDVDEPEDLSNEPRRITTLSHKLDGFGFRDGRRTHVAIVMRSGRIIQLTSGDFDYAQPALSPCRQYLAFSSNRSENRDNERGVDIWLLDLDNDSLRQVTSGDGVYGLPSFSPDSEHLAFVGHQVQPPWGPTALDRLWVADLHGGHVHCASENIDREMSNTCTGDTGYVVPAQRPVWFADSGSIYSLMSDRGSVSIVRINLDGSHTSVVAGEREAVNFSLSESGTLAFSASNPIRPAEIFLLDGDGNEESRQVTDHNRELLATVDILSPSYTPYAATDGTMIDAWLLEPSDRRDNARYPLVLEIHGGPHAMYGHTFFHEFQLLAAQGYAVLYTNPRGSTGYGQDFVSAAMCDWGGVDYQDVMDGVEHICDTVPWIDQNRLAMTGGSYGGYLVNWMLTQTDRFAAAITQRSTCNRHNLFGTSDMVWSYSSWEFRGEPWEQPEFYLDRSPLSHVEAITTPVLIMHSERDLRCPVEQGEQFFTALKRLGKTAEFVRFPDESHGLSRTGRPDRRQARLAWMLRWYDRFL